MLRPIRRVVTTTNAEGHAIVAKDEACTSTFEYAGIPGRGLTDLWTEPGQADGIQLDPPPGGSLFRIFQIPPNSESNPPELLASAFQELGAESGAKGTHTTRTIDYVIILSGQLILQLHDEEVILNPLDTVIQQSTTHAWINRTDTPALGAAVLVAKN